MQVPLSGVAAAGYNGPGSYSGQETILQPFNPGVLLSDAVLYQEHVNVAVTQGSRLFVSGNFSITSRSTSQAS